MKKHNFAQKSFLAVVCMLGILLLQSSILLVSAEANSDWIVKLSQSPGTKAAVEGGWTRDGEPIDHPGGFYTLFCDGEEKTKRILKGEIATEPNDADYDIRIWWPDGTFEKHEFERIPAPGSKKYTHSSPSYEVVFEVFPAPTAPKEVPAITLLGLIALIGILIIFSASWIVKRKKNK